MGSINLKQADQQHVWHPFDAFRQASDNILIKRGEGAFLITEDGRRIYDAISSWWVNLHGHAHPHIAAAIAKQASTLEQVIFSGFTHEPAVTLASRLAAKLPGDLSKVFFSDNGSTSVEVALKMAIQYAYNQGKQKKKMIAIHGAYHGDTFGAMAVGERGLFTRPFEEKLFEVDFLPFPDGENDAEVIAAMHKFTKDKDVAAFIYEPLLQGSAGMRTYSAEVLDQLMTIARKNEVLCIADEVFTGFGRTGKWFASEYLSSSPDIICLSKGITGGFLPLGVTVCTEKIYRKFDSKDAEHLFYHGHSYTANPIACAAANASWELMEKEETWTNIKKIESMHQGFIKQIKDYPSVIRASSSGTIFSVEIKSETETGYTNAIREKLYTHFLNRNILVRPLGNILYLVPPYNTPENTLVEVYAEIDNLLRNPDLVY
jgi:adenosylmethionine-8-amino-7-oxononanoate aminotransferase